MATQLSHPSSSLIHSLCNPFCIQNGNAPLHSASKNGHRDLADLLLRHKADPNLRSQVTRGERVGGWGLWWYDLALRLRVVVVESMGDFFCGSLPQQGYAPLHYAAKHDKEHVARVLVEHKADLEAKVYTEMRDPHDSHARALSHIYTTSARRIYLYTCIRTLEICPEETYL